MNMVKILKAIGEENRLQIIRLLLRSDLCVGALARTLNISKPAVSQHLKILREAGLVRGEKLGYWTHYKVEKELIRESSHYLQELIESQADVICKDITCNDVTCNDVTCNNALTCLQKKES